MLWKKGKESDFPSTNMLNYSDYKYCGFIAWELQIIWNCSEFFYCLHQTWAVRLWLIIGKGHYKAAFYFLIFESDIFNTVSSLSPLSHLASVMMNFFRIPFERPFYIFVFSKLPSTFPTIENVCLPHKSHPLVCLPRGNRCSVSCTF